MLEPLVVVLVADALAAPVIATAERTTTTTRTARVSFFMVLTLRDDDCYFRYQAISPAQYLDTNSINLF